MSGLSGLHGQNCSSSILDQFHQNHFPCCSVSLAHHLSETQDQLHCRFRIGLGLNLNSYLDLGLAVLLSSDLSPCSSHDSHLSPDSGPYPCPGLDQNLDPDPDPNPDHVTNPEQRSNHDPSP